MINSVAQSTFVSGWNRNVFTVLMSMAGLWCGTLARLERFPSKTLFTCTVKFGNGVAKDCLIIF